MSFGMLDANGNLSRKAEISCVVIAAICTLVVLVMAIITATTGQLNPHINVIEANADPTTNTVEMIVDLNDMPYSGASLFPAQAVGEGDYLLMHSLPFTAANAKSVLVGFSYIDVQNGAELVFLLVTPDDLSYILDHSDVGAADGFKTVNITELSGTTVLHLPAGQTVRLY